MNFVLLRGATRLAHFGFNGYYFPVFLIHACGAIHARTTAKAEGAISPAKSFCTLLIERGAVVFRLSLSVACLFGFRRWQGGFSSGIFVRSALQGILFLLFSWTGGNWHWLSCAMGTRGRLIDCLPVLGALVYGLCVG